MCGIGVGAGIMSYFNLNGVWAVSVIAGAIALTLGAWAFTGGTISVGFFTMTVPESKVLVPICLALLGFSIADMFSITKAMTGACANVGAFCGGLSNIILLLMALLNLGYCIAIIQFWRGNDIS